MITFNKDSERPLGQGRQTATGAVTDVELMNRLSAYKRAVASSYLALGGDETARLPSGPLWVSPKIDGELWFLILGPDPVLVNPRGAVLHGEIELLVEAKLAGARAFEGTILAGELWALPAEKGRRARCGDLAAAMGGEAAAETRRIAFSAFDLLAGGDGGTAERYADRFATLGRLLEGGKRLSPVKTEVVGSAPAVDGLFSEWVAGGRGEGLVVRGQDYRIYKVKPFFSFDAVIIGYTESAEKPDTVRSVLLALMREDGSFQVTSSCGNFGGDEVRTQMLRRLEGLRVQSSYRHANSSGELYRFVRPEVVIEVRCSDVQAEDSSGARIPRMVLSFDGAWKALAPMPGVSVLHPVFERVRGDKTVNVVDVRLAQLTERVLIPEVADKVRAESWPKSEVLLRKVWTKVTKGRVAVRKLLLWKTNKDGTGEFPAFVVHWTDYAPDRKTPLERDVRLATEEASARLIVEATIPEYVKKGWELSG